MKKTTLLATLVAALAPALSAFAGQMISPPTQPDGKDAKAGKELQVTEKHSFFPEDPAGLFTVGTLFSEHLSGAYIDTITGLYATQDRNSFFFLNSRYHYEDDSQFLNSTGLGFRQRLPGREVIFGINGFYDSISSERNNDYTQGGVGLEVLTHWVDARVNYSVPDDNVYEVERNRGTKRFEAAREGGDAEIGFLIPGIEKVAEVRIFGGYYHYENRFGSDFDGFKARLEARLLPGVIADVEYWDDSALTGGHWTAGVRASVPFSLINVLRGRNPFEGAAEYFKPRPREFQERMSEMVIRQPRILTTTSAPLSGGFKHTFE